MRDLFAVLVIVLAVIVLGIFRVPNENALVSAGIRAAAEGAVYQAHHPLQIAVKGHAVTVSGRVESEAEAERVVAKLGDLEGVEQVLNDLTILPTVAPFALSLGKGAEGYGLDGVVPDDGTAGAIAAALGLDEVPLTVAAGAPDARWAGLAIRAAQVLAGMEEGAVRLIDHDLEVSGWVHVPNQKAALEAAFHDLPEGYAAKLSLEARDDGLPYRFVISRDALMGVRYSGKMPAGWRPSGLGGITGPVTYWQLQEAFKDQDSAAFKQATDTALQLFDLLPQGTISVAPGVIAVQGGPVPQDIMDRFAAMDRPQDWAVTLALIPEDTGGPLVFEADWDGLALRISGRLPKDFWRSVDGAGNIDPPALVAQRTGISVPQVIASDTRSPYPDLQNWAGPVWPGLRALLGLESGQLVRDAEGVRLIGAAANPAARQMARSVLGDHGQAEIQLIDDGAPAEFELVYDAATGAAVAGKLPLGLTPAQMAEALALPELRGAPKVAPGGDAAPVLAALRGLRPYLSLLDAMTLRFAPDGLSLRVEATQGVQLAGLQRALILPRAVTLEVVAAQPPLPGTQRTHVVLDQPQVFADGYWRPVLRFEHSLPGCNAAMAAAPPVPFDVGSFVPAPGAVHPLAELAAVASACTWTGEMQLQIRVTAGGTGYPALDRQLARRRAEALKTALVERGVAMSRISASGQAGSVEGARYLWQ